MGVRSMVAVALLVGFGIGILSAQSASSKAAMAGTVMDANSIPERIEYWELRGSGGESIVVTGARDLGVIKWLRQSKGRKVRLTVEIDETSAISAAAQAPERHLPASYWLDGGPIRPAARRAPGSNR
jgi:hypothetical protein